MQNNRVVRFINNEGQMVTLMTGLLLLAIALLIVGGILVSYAEALG